MCELWNYSYRAKGSKLLPEAAKRNNAIDYVDWVLSRPGRLELNRDIWASRRQRSGFRDRVSQTEKNRDNRQLVVAKNYKKLSYRRGTARCVVSVEILPIATQQCRNYLYDKSWTCSWLPPFRKQNFLLFIQPRWQLRRTYLFNHYNVLF